MQAMLDELAKAIAPKAQAMIIMDRADWHRAQALAVPDRLTLACLPPYSPELNVIQRVWPHLKEYYLSHRVWPVYDDKLDAVGDAWNKLLHQPGRIKSLTDAAWIASLEN